MRLIICALAIGAAIALSGTGSAHQSPVEIAAIDCVFHIEIIKLGNYGNSAEDMTGWQLRSDPEQSEWIDLSFIGTIDPGEEVFFVGGPHAVAEPQSGVYVFLNYYALRDSGSPADYVRLVEPNGEEADRQDCPSDGAPAEPTPAIIPELTPEPTPTPAPPQAAASTPTPAPVAATRNRQVAPVDETDPRVVVDYIVPLPAQGGLPPVDGVSTLPLVLGLALIASGAGLVVLGARRS